MTHDLSSTAEEPPLITRMFELQAAQTPAAIAIEWGGQQLTYQELNQQANRLAHALRARGVGPERLVGLYLERSPELLVAILGVLKAGGAYVPLDPGYPAERLTLIVRDSALPLLLTRQTLPLPLPAQQAAVLDLNADWSEICQQSDQNPCQLAQPANAAYVIYTSGSTGQPKGALIAHESLARHCRTAQHVYQLTAADRVLQFASINFDASIEQLLLPLLVGACVVLRDPLPWDAATLYARIIERRLTVVNLPTAYWQQVVQVWAQTPQLIMPPDLRLVIVGGDALTADAVAVWQSTALRSARLLNAYGPTETTITATVFEVPPDQPPTNAIPIGAPLRHRAAYILDDNLQPVPVGATGDLYLGGIGLARGYLNAPGPTAANFVPDPFSQAPGSRMYKTGDLARLLPDATIVFVGRRDHQVKLRGYRIELGEIESALRQHPAVREAVAVIQPLGTSEKEVIGYVVLHTAQAYDPRALIASLRERLPDYAIPRAIVVLAELPVSANGKIDRSALPRPSAADYIGQSAGATPRTPTEQMLAEIWSAILGTERFGIHDDFLALGGHSLLATQVISRVQQIYQVSIPITRLFEQPTIAQLAALIDERRGASRLAARSKIVPVPRQARRLERH